MSKGYHFVAIVITSIIALATVAIWAYVNRPGQEPAWPEIIPGFSFMPLRLQHDPMQKKFPTAEEINEDLALLSGRSHAIRSYTVEDVFAEIPRLAFDHGINVTLGAWLEKDEEKNKAELEHFIQVAKENRQNVVRGIVGNEAILRTDLTVDQMIPYLDRARQELQIPVSTAEPWHTWLNNPKLVEHVDFIAVHMLPFWEGVGLEQSIDYIVMRMNELKTAYPGKPIVISEVGWPSYGRTRKEAEATLANQAVFLRRFIDRANKENYTFYIMEAFDQPWKRKLEGAVGAYWGVWDVQRKPKFELQAPIVQTPEWRALAAISIVIAAITLGFLFIDSGTLNIQGRSFLAIVSFAASTLAVWVAYDFLIQYQTLDTAVVGILLMIGMIGVILVLLAEAHEWAEAIWVHSRRRSLKLMRVEDRLLPMVSVHVPAYNEPPDMMKATLDALSRLDYPNFEVIVIDNNTKDPEVWEPVEAHCALLGERFRFFHKAPLAGYKAGALNFALGETRPDAEIVAVIDSDYQVTPNWLRDLVPQFSSEKIAVVQAPQDYRDSDENAFKAMCYAEYRGFFHIGMVTRNERNAIIQHGTMTMVRRKVLEDVGKWGEWTITEDADLGLRVFEEGYEATYIANSYGKGLMPDTFTDFKKQRYRWAYGALQILKHHAAQLFGGKKCQLCAGQRYHFVAGWLPWIADGINLIFNLAAIFWSLAIIALPQYVSAPQIIYSALPLSLFVFKLSKLFFLYRTNVEASMRQTLAAAIAGLALSHTIARAVLAGLVTRSIPFFRTPKQADTAALWKAIVAAREETAFFIALLLAAGGVHWMTEEPERERLAWIWMLGIQAIPYGAALLVSLISGMPRLPARLIGPRFREEMPAAATEG
ncbi:MAG: beta-(1-3)-glucosyl transferase [Gammaproteobacteria bacterium RIFOXYA12_FULL_61_12]|nr:MAG: beta-(1-3)-glucosyl transferase [Gammaproteobacteria bacterium RIFOXYA12_FULL_61_12]OGT88571.1 MAG: beta-(1-3)-glucosyl transferase [Gammaproteobacteria bacterium RIFOXYD12_FULL_61_37]